MFFKVILSFFFISFYLSFIYLAAKINLIFWFRWRKEIEEELSILRSALEKVEERISTMYTCPELQVQEYRLHAVMVHEGDVNQECLLLSIHN